MSDKPAVVIIRCQNCKRQYLPQYVVEVNGICPHCPTSAWHLQAEYNALRGASEGTNAALLANIGINAIGIGLLVTTGTGFTTSIGGLSDGYEQATGGKSVADIYDVSGDQLCALCTPAKLAPVQLAAFVGRKEIEIQRNRMLERGGSHCKACKILFVPAASKPWTLVGACSKSCCASMHGFSDYSQIEESVNEATRITTQQFAQAAKEKSYIKADCPCGTSFSLPQMYQGTYRKCPNCQAKVLVPLGS